MITIRSHGWCIVVPDSFPFLPLVQDLREDRAAAVEVGIREPRSEEPAGRKM